MYCCPFVLCQCCPYIKHHSCVCVYFNLGTSMPGPFHNFPSLVFLFGISIEDLSMSSITPPTAPFRPFVQRSNSQRQMSPLTLSHVYCLLSYKGNYIGATNSDPTRASLSFSKNSLSSMSLWRWSHSFCPAPKSKQKNICSLGEEFL